MPFCATAAWRALLPPEFYVAFCSPRFACALRLYFGNAVSRCERSRIGSRHCRLAEILAIGPRHGLRCKYRRGHDEFSFRPLSAAEKTCRGGRAKTAALRHAAPFLFLASAGRGCPSLGGRLAADAVGTITSLDFLRQSRPVCRRHNSCPRPVELNRCQSAI